MIDLRVKLTGYMKFELKGVMKDYDLPIYNNEVNKCTLPVTSRPVYEMKNFIREYFEGKIGDNKLREIFDLCPRCEVCGKELEKPIEDTLTIDKLAECKAKMYGVKTHLTCSEDCMEKLADKLGTTMAPIKDILKV